MDLRVVRHGITRQNAIRFLASIKEQFIGNSIQYGVCASHSMDYKDKLSWTVILLSMLTCKEIYRLEIREHYLLGRNKVFGFKIINIDTRIYFLPVLVGSIPGKGMSSLIKTLVYNAVHFFT